jgi:hypothetical protein
MGTMLPFSERLVGLGAGARWRLGLLSVRAATLVELLGFLVTPARAFDLHADGALDHAIEDGHGEGGIAEVATPGGEFDIAGHQGRAVTDALVDEGEEHLSGGGLVL